MASLQDIGNIIVEYPEVGIDQPSQGFRDNFKYIQSSLTSIDGDLETLKSNVGKIDTLTKPPVDNDVLIYSVSIDKWTPKSLRSDLGYLTAIIQDITPQLGGNLEVGTFRIIKDSTPVLDFVGVANAINYVTLSNNLTNKNPIISVDGSDTNINLDIKAKGTGSIIFGNGDSTGISISGESNKNFSITGPSHTSASGIPLTTLSGSDNTNGAGGNVVVSGGNSIGGNNKGGDAIIKTGSPSGTGADGQVKILDSSSNEIVFFQTVGATAANYLNIRNSDHGLPLTIEAAPLSPDNNIDIQILPKGTGRITLGNLKWPFNDGEDGFVLTTNGAGDLSFESNPGEANTASNLGGGTGIFASKVGVDLQFKSLKAGDNITISPVTPIEVTINADFQSIDVLTDTNISSPSIGQYLAFDGTHWINSTLSASDIGAVNSAINRGTGAGIFYVKTGSALEFRSLKSGSHINLTPSSDEILIDSVSYSLDELIDVTITSPANTNYLSYNGTEWVNAPLTNIITGGTNLGTGNGIFGSKLGSNLQFKSLVAGDNVTLTSTANDVTISSTGGSVGYEILPKAIHTLNDNQTIGQAIMTYTASGHSTTWIDYIITRGTVKQMGTVRILTDGTDIVMDDTVLAMSSTGVKFDASVASGTVSWLYTTTLTGTSGTISYTIRRMDG